MALVLGGLGMLIVVLNMGSYRLTAQSVKAGIDDTAQANIFLNTASNIANKDYHSVFAFSSAIKMKIVDANKAIEAANEKEENADDENNNDKTNNGENTTNSPAKETDSVEQKTTEKDNSAGAEKPDAIEEIDSDVVTLLVKNSISGPLQQNNSLLLILVIGLFTAGSIIFSCAKYLGKQPGISNNNVFKKSVSSKGIVAIFVCAGLIAFYCVLYWYPWLLANLIKLTDPLSYALSGHGADDGFLYGTIYSFAVLLLGIKMFLKYRHSKYQKIRTVSVTFFQLSFAFIIPEILRSLKKPALDLKNIWPLDYSFFWNSNIDELIANGKLGIFMLVWGIVLLVIIVPLFTYFFGKRWYCSWVCGCGGLAETAGDPFRHLSSKKLTAWKIERVLIYSVLVVIVLITAVTLINYFSQGNLLGSATEITQEWYGFLIGSIFAGVIGTGLYPIMGSRVWCRFGCPLSAIFGIIQRYKSRFRITTNGGQCISCGNCSTYCEMGIDVKAYAQKGQNIVRASCVGCGICAEVCPRGVLKLENAGEAGRVNNNPIIIGNNSIEVRL